MPFEPSNTNRICTRGELQTFKAGFFADDAHTIALEPLDPSIYPSFTIYDINNTAYQSGVAVQDGPAGFYKVDFLVPTTAPLSYDEKRWRIEWLLVTANNRQVEFIEEFDVRDLVVTSTETHELQLLALENKPFQVTLRLAQRPATITLDVFMARDANTIIASNVAPTETIDGDSYFYTYEIGPNLLLGNTLYTALWSIKDAATSTTRFEYQQLSCIAMMMLPMMTSLRMLIDKFQVRLSRSVSYQDSDLSEYLARGQEWVNAAYPTTWFTIQSTPAGLLYFTVLAAAVWGLKAQGLTFLMMDFNFSGQTVTLDVGDKQAQLDSWSTNLLTFLQANLTAAKMTYVRRMRGTGTVAGRPYRYNSLYNFVYKLQTFNSGDFGTMLTKIGIL